MSRDLADQQHYFMETALRFVDYYINRLIASQKDYSLLDKIAPNVISALQTASDVGSDGLLLVRGIIAFCPFLLARGRLDIAQARLKDAKKIIHSIVNPALEGTVYLFLGRTAIARGDYAAAEIEFQMGLKIINDFPALAALRGELLQGEGVIADHQGDYSRAEKLYLECLELARLTGQQESLVRLLLDLGGLALDRGNAARSEEYLLEAQQLARETKDYEDLSPILVNMGAIAAARGEYEREEGFYREALAVSRQIGHRENITYVLTNLGQVMRDRGDFTQAEEYLQEGLTIALQIGHHERIAALNRYLGDLSIIKKDYETASKYFENGLMIAREMGHRRLIVALLSGRGEIRFLYKEIERAESDLKESLDQAKASGMSWYVSDVQRKLGVLYIYESRLGEAAEFLEASLVIALKLEDQELIADAKLGLAKLRLACGDQVGSRAQGLEAFNIMKAIHHYRVQEIQDWLSSL